MVSVRTDVRADVMRKSADKDLSRERLYWHCRRGMLELDLLLQEFLKAHYDYISVSEKQTFARLLEYPDVVLFELLMGRSVTADQEIARVIEKIRTTPATSAT